MSKKIIFIQGSPRKNGNTRAMVTAAMEEARKQGAAVTEIDATTMEFKMLGCIGCQQCQQSDKYECVYKDQVTQAVASLPKYDVIVFASPLYWWSYTAQIKMLIDRVYSLMKFNDKGEIHTPLAGKKLALLATGGGPYENNLDVLESQLKFPAEMLGCTFASCVFPNASPDPGALGKDAAAFKKAQDFGRLLATGQ
jgi:multimeric flavodoxin WrbA